MHSCSHQLIAEQEAQLQPCQFMMQAWTGQQVARTTSISPTSRCRAGDAGLPPNTPCMTRHAQFAAGWGAKLKCHRMQANMAVCMACWTAAGQGRGAH